MVAAPRLDQKPLTADSNIAIVWPIGVQPIVTAEQFAEIASANPELRLELSAKGQLIVMPPTGMDTGDRNSSLGGQFYVWRSQNPTLGRTFDSSTGFTLPDGSIVSPDASWIAQTRLDALTPEEKKGFAPISPDVVVELRSATDSLSTLQEKMKHYIANGVRLGVMINPKQKTIELYRPDAEVEVLNSPKKVDLDEIMPAFKLDISEIWG